jgi:hypothetical protein
LEIGHDNLGFDEPPMVIMCAGSWWWQRRGRLMDAHWVDGRAGYRCRHGYNSARPTSPGRPRNLYVREDILLLELAQRLMIDRDACESDALQVVAHLRSRTTVIVHYRTGWRAAARDEVEFNTPHHAQLPAGHKSSIELSVDRLEVLHRE